MIKSRTIPTTKKGFKLFMLMAFVLIHSQLANAQTDSLQYSEEILEDSMVQYLTPLEYAFMMHEETPWMIKANLILSSPFEDGNLSASFEHRIFKNYSLNSTLSYRLLDNDYTNFTQSRYMLSLEPRWYYNMSENVKKRKSRYNLSGNYISIGFAGGYENNKRTDDFGDHSTEYEVDMGNNNSITENLGVLSAFAKWGIQRRFLKKGYMDFGFIVNYDFYPGSDKSSFFSVSSFINAGFAFAKDKQKNKLNKEKLCPVLRCYAADRYLFKLNIIGLMSIGMSENVLLYSANPEFAFEVKLGNSPFSINTDITFSANNQSYIDYELDSYFKLSAKLDGRWYYNLNKRMLKGKTGNGLSANYFSIGGSYSLSRTNFKKEFSDSRFWKEIYYSYDAGIIFLTGIQRTYAEHLYFDVNIGFGIYSELNGYGYEPYSDFTGMIAIGYRF